MDILRVRLSYLVILLISLIFSVCCLHAQSDRVDYLIVLLHNEPTRIDAIGELGQIKDVRVVPTLIELLEHRRTLAPEYAAKALGQIGDARAIEPLINAVTEEIKDESIIRNQFIKTALETLRQFGTPAVEPLITLLDSANNLVRSCAAESLGEIKNTRAVDPLIRRLKDEDDRVQSAAATALGEIGDLRALPCLIDNLKDYSDYSSAFAAAKAVAKFGNQAVPLLISVLRTDEEITSAHDGAIKTLGVIGSPAVEPLMALLKTANPRLKREATSALALIKDDRSTDSLIPLLRNSDIDVRKEAIFALGEIKSTRATIPLIGLLKDPDLALRENAIKALGEIKDPRAVDSLITALKEKDSAVQDIASEALGMIGQPAVESLIGILRDSRYLVRLYAAIALGTIKDPRSVEPLIALLKDVNEKVRKEAARALGDIADERAAGALTIDLENPDLVIVAGAHRFFIRAGNDKWEPILAQALYAYGDGNMAQAFLDCRNPVLGAAARIWADHNNYKIVMGGLSSRSVRWGAH